MKNLNEHAWVRQWKEIPAGRRALLSAAFWGLLSIVICQLLWLPGQARMQQAEHALAREHELAATLQRIVQGPRRSPGAVELLTPAGLNERAKAAGVHIVSLEAKAGQVDVGLEGPVAAVLAWLHVLEHDGGEALNIQLQAEGELLQARLVMALPKA
ncbi:hypothetical protein A0O30_10115 [Pseudomonas sp. LLC-1]|uniref:hypothetical protein n=1 Tax=Pseudomonas sp. LLC-1 TaxID=1812180 RepID=UPI000D014F80|nr:hypothetical protein [Pseudomonas sp. LLC-1]PRN05141.1 hypothetical protein A0O30_10115 [Pseudomonas sp. LLC-1]